jgi:hypothetical protein
VPAGLLPIIFVDDWIVLGKFDGSTRLAPLSITLALPWRALRSCLYLLLLRHRPEKCKEPSDVRDMRLDGDTHHRFSELSYAAQAGGMACRTDGNLGVVAQTPLLR